MSRTGQDLVNEVRDNLDEPYEQNWSDSKLLSWVNKGIVRLVNATRAQRAHWFDTVILSTDSASTIRGETYTPTTALKPTAGASTITLPPNCIEVVSITPLDQDDLDNGLEFELSRPNAAEFMYAQRLAQADNQWTYLYYTRGTRTVQVAPIFGTSFDIRLQYVAMPDDLTASTSPSTVAEWMLDLAVLYAEYRALYAIKHPDFAAARVTYDAEEKKMMGLNRPRESSGPVLVESVLDEFSSWVN